MQGTGASGFQPTEGQRAVAAHRGAPLLVLGGAGTGRTQALALRLAGYAADGLAPHRVLALTRSRAAAALLRGRAEEAIDAPYEELWVMTYEEASERLLRDFAAAAGVDPFFATVGAADRLAMLLDRVDELPLRRHEIRGNAAGLLARLMSRIDALKADAIAPDRLRDWAEAREREARDGGERERARREIEFAELYARHDRILREAGSLDSTDLVLELTRVLSDRADILDDMRDRFGAVIADELEDAGAAHRGLLDALEPLGELTCAADPRQAVRRVRSGADAALAAFRAKHPDLAEIELTGSLRFGNAIATAAAAIVGCATAAGGTVPAPSGERPIDAEADLVRFWRCRDERAQAQGVAREVEHLLAAGETRPEAVCVVVGSGWREGRLVAAALEERSVPFRFAGDAAFFQRPEVRDALAWLRMLANPGDSAAVVRALTRPPVELRSVDLARVTTIARRRKLDMVSALGAALDSPQLRARGARSDPELPPPARRGRRGPGGDARRRVRSPPDRTGWRCAVTACSPPARRPRSGSRPSPALPISRPHGRVASRADRPGTSFVISPRSPMRGRSATRSATRPPRDRWCWPSRSR